MGWDSEASSLRKRSSRTHTRRGAEGGGAQPGGAAWGLLARGSAGGGDLVSQGETPAWDPGADLGVVVGSETPGGMGLPHGSFLQCLEWHLLSSFLQKRRLGLRGGGACLGHTAKGRPQPSSGEGHTPLGLIPPPPLPLKFSPCSGWLLRPLLCVYRVSEASQR